MEKICGVGPEGPSFLRRKRLRKPIELADTYPQSFGYFLIKSSSWQAVGLTEKQMKEKGMFFFD